MNKFNNLIKTSFILGEIVVMVKYLGWKINFNKNAKSIIIFSSQNINKNNN